MKRLFIDESLIETQNHIYTFFYVIKKKYTKNYFPYIRCTIVSGPDLEHFNVAMYNREKTRTIVLKIYC